ncbi:hypothetical protein MC885_016687, partial [Smutsia gigantea]
RPQRSLSPEGGSSATQQATLSPSFPVAWPNPALDQSPQQNPTDPRILPLSKKPASSAELLSSCGQPQTSTHFQRGLPSGVFSLPTQGTEGAQDTGSFGDLVSGSATEDNDGRLRCSTSSVWMLFSPVGCHLLSVSPLGTPAPATWTSLVHPVCSLSSHCAFSLLSQDTLCCPVPTWPLDGMTNTCRLMDSRFSLFYPAWDPLLMKMPSGSHHSGCPLDAGFAMSPDW